MSATPNGISRIDLICCGGSWPWPHGEAFSVPRDVAALAAFEPNPAAEFLLFWDAELGPPSPAKVAALIEEPGDLWHAGLALGQGGRPALLDAVHPTWMLQRDPPTEEVASSWRLSLRATLMRAEVFRLGRPDPNFRTLAGAALELGHRYLAAGVLLRHHPELVPSASRSAEEPLPLFDQWLFLRRRCGAFWTGWAGARAWVSGRLRWSELRLWRTRELPSPAPPPPSQRTSPAPRVAGLVCARRQAPGRPLQISVLIPTLDRYPYLERLLEQLRHQKLAPLEILLIDQTPSARRRRDWPRDFPDLPIRYFEQEKAGQCSSRNLGLLAARGEAVLFLDDDDEIGPDLLALHDLALRRAGADASCGVADEVGQDPLPPEFQTRRLSDVFPTNNSLVRRSALERSGLFDLAFEKGARADADLGQRLYLSGALLVLDPEIRVLHHHAPAGGLRRHGARRMTYGASRRQLLARHLPSTSEIYLARRHFTAIQAREAMWLRVGGTFVVRGGLAKKLAKIVWATLVLPHTLWVLGRRWREATRWLAEYPQIPTLPGNAP